MYVVRADGTDRRRLHRGGDQAHFGGDPSRVFFVDRSYEGGEAKTTLKSIGLDGTEEREHLTSTWATDFRVSPDGRWVAFRERFHVYVTPMPATGRAVSVAASGKGLPVARVSANAGRDLGWSADSKAPLAPRSGAVHPLPRGHLHLPGRRRT